MIRQNIEVFDDFDIEQGDLVDFGADGVKYVIGCRGNVNYLKVSDSAEDRYNSKAKGYEVHSSYALRIVEKGVRHEESLSDKLHKAHEMVRDGRLSEVVDYVLTDGEDAQYILMFLMKILCEDEERLEGYREIDNKLRKKMSGVDW